MQLSNKKLVSRGVRMVMDELNIKEELANKLLQKHKSVRKTLEAYKDEVK